MSVVSKTAESNAVTPYFVSALAGPRIGRRRVQKGDEVQMSEHQARGLIATGELVADKALVDDPFGEAKAAADAKALADKAAADKAAHDAQVAAAADAAQKAAEAEAARLAAEKAAAEAASDHHDDASHDDAHDDHPTT